MLQRIRKKGKGQLLYIALSLWDRKGYRFVSLYFNTPYIQIIKINNETVVNENLLLIEFLLFYFDLMFVIDKHFLFLSPLNKSNNFFSLLPVNQFEQTRIKFYFMQIKNFLSIIYYHTVRITFLANK